MPPVKCKYIRCITKPKGPSPGPPTRLMLGIFQSARLHRREAPDSIRRNLADAEATAQTIRGCLTEEEIKWSLQLWFLTQVPLVLDPGSTRGRVAQYQKTLDAFRSQKMVMVRALMERGEVYNEILLQQDEIIGLLNQILKNQREQHKFNQQLASRLGMAVNKVPHSGLHPDFPATVDSDSDAPKKKVYKMLFG